MFSEGYNPTTNNVAKKITHPLKNSPNGDVASVCQVPHKFKVEAMTTYHHYDQVLGLVRESSFSGRAAVVLVTQAAFDVWPHTVYH